MTYFNGKEISFDPNDWKGIYELMKQHEKFDVPWCGINEDGERIMISVNRDNITVETFQKNGWIRENIYHEDYTVEEFYRR